VKDKLIFELDKDIVDLSIPEILGYLKGKI